MSKWADVEKGDVVELIGKQFTVVKIKPKGKKARVKITRGNGRDYSDEVKLGDKVRIVKRAADVDPVQNRDGSQRRWAKPAELAAALGPALKPGDPERVKPPEKAKGGKWKAPEGEVEKRLSSLLEARLVGESKNEAEGYYVPPAKVDTVASHLALFHAYDMSDADDTALIRVHDAQHAEAASRGVPLAVNHWHTEIRP